MTRVSTFASILLASLFLIAAQAARAQDNGPAPQDALDAGNAFLSLIDHNQYDASWDACATSIKNGISKPAWNTVMTVNRARFATLVSRKLVLTQTVSSLPGSADGEYAVLRYRSSFNSKRTGLETVTLTKEGGKWVGYQYSIKDVKTHQ